MKPIGDEGLRKPREGEGVICPQPAYEQRRAHPPAKVYESRGQDGKPIVRGILAPHKHWRQNDECPWTGHPVIVVPLPQPKKLE